MSRLAFWLVLIYLFSFSVLWGTYRCVCVCVCVCARARPRVLCRLCLAEGCLPRMDYQWYSPE